MLDNEKAACRQLGLDENSTQLTNEKIDEALQAKQHECQADMADGPLRDEKLQEYQSAADVLKEMNRREQERKDAENDAALRDGKKKMLPQENKGVKDAHKEARERVWDMRELKKGEWAAKHKAHLDLKLNTGDLFLHLLMTTLMVARPPKFKFTPPPDDKILTPEIKKDKQQAYDDLVRKYTKDGKLEIIDLGGGKCIGKFKNNAEGKCFAEEVHKLKLGEVGTAANPAKPQEEPKPKDDFTVRPRMR